MTDIDDAYTAGRYDQALRLILESFESAASGLGGPRLDFMVTYTWERLIDVGYAPARDAMMRVRDEQRARLLAGEFIFGAQDQTWPLSRLDVILDMNANLKDSRSSYDTFIQLLDVAPEEARRHVFRVLPAMVDVGDYTRAESYLGDPLTDLDSLNAQARAAPLYALRGQPPRTWAELHNFVNSVSLLMAAHRGLGREADAQSLQAAALAGIENEELRAMAGREIATPGLMQREIGEYLARSEA